MVWVAWWGGNEVTKSQGQGQIQVLQALKLLQFVGWGAFKEKK